VNNRPEVDSFKIAINLVRVLAHVGSIHVEVVPHLIDVQSDHVNTGFDFINSHVKQALSVLVVTPDVLPVIRIDVVIIVVILGVLHLDLEPDGLVAPPGVGVVQTQPVVSVFLHDTVKLSLSDHKILIKWLETGVRSCQPDCDVIPSSWCTAPGNLELKVNSLPCLDIIDEEALLLSCHHRYRHLSVS